MYKIQIPPTSENIIVKGTALETNVFSTVKTLEKKLKHKYSNCRKLRKSVGTYILPIISLF